MKYPENTNINHVPVASGIVDGAAAVLIGNKEMGKKQFKTRAKIKAFSL